MVPPDHLRHRKWPPSATDGPPCNNHSGDHWLLSSMATDYYVATELVSDNYIFLLIAWQLYT